MRAYLVAMAALLLFVACKGDEKGPGAGVPSGPATPPAGMTSGPATPPAEKTPGPETPPAVAAAPKTGTGPSSTAPPDAAIAVVDRAIEAAGGLEALTEKFGAYTVVSKGLYIGVPYEMTSVWKAPDRMFMAIATGGMEMGYVGETCWNVLNGVVIDCAPEEVKSVPTQLYLARVEGLYTLKQPGFQVALKGAGEVNGRATDAVEVTHPDEPVPVWMEFYKDSGLLARTRYEGSFGGIDGPVTHDILTYRQVDGVQVPLKSVVSAGGKTFVEDMMKAITWAADDAVFERPPQRAFGAPAVRELDARTVAYVTHEGAYEGIGATVGGLMAWATEAGLELMGPPTMVYLTSPGQTTDPAMYRTEIQVPVSAHRDLTAAHAVYSIKRVDPMTVATRLEKGPYDQAAAGIGPLAAWCTDNGYAVAGPPMMTGYSDPSRTPPGDLLNEILLPIEKAE
jgi:effector-binding domain-containing protein